MAQNKRGVTKARNYRACPFCDSRHLSVESKTNAWNSQDRELHVVCNDCASSSPIYIWNQRAVNCT